MLSFGAILQNRYQVAALLGQGGFGAVYRANDLRLAGRVVAIKENLAVAHDAVVAFQNEALLLARLQHDNLPRVTDHFIDPSGAQYLVMDYIEGENLEDAVARRGPLPEREALDVIGQVIAAVGYLHSQRVVHRDIKPANLIRRAGDRRVMLVDFGIAKLDTHAGATLTGARAATPGFAPPEQYSGHTDTRSDVYALGATLYYLLTGRVPPEATARAAGLAAFVPLRQLNPAIEPRVSAAVAHALEMDTARRTQSVERFSAELAASPSRTALPPVPGKYLVWAGAALLVVAILAVVFASANRPPDIAAKGPGSRATVPAPAIATKTLAPTGTSAPAAIMLRPTDAPALVPTIAATEAPATPTHTAAPSATNTSYLEPTAAPAPSATPTFETCDPGETFYAAWSPRQDRLGCPQGSVGRRTFTLQDYVGGLMFWSKDTDSIYVLRDRGGWTSSKNLWQSGEPLYSCAEAEQASMPRMGFGKVWCEEGEVRASLGAALGLEQADDYAWLQFFEQGVLIGGFGGRVFVLYDDGGWEEAQGGA